MADMIVSGAGTSFVNGTYVEIGTLNGKPQYQYSTNRYLQWSGTKWEIIVAGVRYYSNDDVATPDLCTTWVQGSGALPVPTVTSSGGGAQNLTLTCAAGSYSLAGVACTLTYTPAAQNLTLSCGAGSYTITGTNADITSSRTLICEPASGGAYPDIIVSGAGTSDANGTYTFFTDALGKPSYTKGSGYFIAFDDFYGYWEIYLSGVEQYYYSTDNVATPDLVTTWAVGTDGIAPVPTVISGTNAYTLTGTDVTLTYTQGAQNLTLTCEAGSLALTGSAATFEVKRNYTLSAAAGSYAVTGSAVTLEFKGNYVLACAAGSYAVTGSPVTFAITRVYTLACNSGSYLLTGTPTSLTSARSLACNSGAYVLTGLESDLFKGLVMPCGAGSYALTGTDVSMTSHRIFALNIGSYVMVGAAAGLFILTATPECRTYFIDAENRTWLIDSEDRTHTIDEENRTLEVRCH